MLTDDLIECGVLKYKCPHCGQEVLDDFELMEVHMSQCGVSCKTCVDMATRILNKEGNCYRCGNHRNWKGRNNA